MQTLKNRKVYFNNFLLSQNKVNSNNIMIKQFLNLIKYMFLMAEVRKIVLLREDSLIKSENLIMKSINLIIVNNIRFVDRET